MTPPDAVRHAILDQCGVEQVRRGARTLAASLGFGPYEIEVVGVVVTELATNLVRYAYAGEIEVASIGGPRGPGIAVASRDAGPGISDVAAALSDGFSSAGGLGGGLPGVRRLMDEFELTSGPAGTIIHCCKWRLSRP